jgi:hypothetical protein
MSYYTLPAKKLLANDSIRSVFVDPLSYMGIYVHDRIIANKNQTWRGHTSDKTCCPWQQTPPGGKSVVTEYNKHYL